MNNFLAIKVYHNLFFRVAITFFMFPTDLINGFSPHATTELSIRETEKEMESMKRFIKDSQIKAFSLEEQPIFNLWR